MRARHHRPGLCALALLIACLIPLTACSRSPMEIDGVPIDPAAYRLAYHNARYEAAIAQSASGSSALHARARQLCAKSVAVEQLCEEYGLTLTENEQNYVSNLTDTMWPSIGETYQANGIDKETWRAYLATVTLQADLFEHLYRAGGELAWPDEILRDEYTRRFAKVEYIHLPIEDLLTRNFTAEEIQQLAEDALEDLRGGDSMEAVLGSLQEAIDDATNANLFLAEVWIDTDQDETGTYSEPFRQSLQKAPAGASGIYETNLFLLVYRTMAEFETDAAFAKERTQVIRTLCYPEFEAYLDDIAAGYEIKHPYGNSIIPKL